MYIRDVGRALGIDYNGMYMKIKITIKLKYSILEVLMYLSINEHVLVIYTPESLGCTSTGILNYLEVFWFCLLHVKI